MRALGDPGTGTGGPMGTGTACWGPPADRESMTKTLHTLHELLASSRVQPGDATGTAAALLWSRLATAHEVPRESPVARLGVVERVVLVLLDAARLSPDEAARHLNTDAATVLAAHATARARVGLPSPSTPPCPAWGLVRAAHREGDPAVIEELLAHVEGCRSCTAAIDDVDAPRRRRGRRAAVAGTPALAGVLGAVPALAATVAVAAAVTAASIAVAPTDDGAQAVTPVPVPVVVDDAPGLPSDSGPSGGVRQPGEPLLHEGIPAAELDATAPDAPAPGDDGADPELPPAVDELVPPAVGDVVDDVTDTVEDVVDDVLPDTPTVPDAPLDEPAPSTDSFGRLKDSLLP